MGERVSCASRWVVQKTVWGLSHGTGQRSQCGDVLDGIRAKEADQFRAIHAVFQAPQDLIGLDKGAQQRFLVVDAGHDVRIGGLGANGLGHVQVPGQSGELAAVQVDDRHDVGTVVAAPLGKSARQPFGLVGGSDDHEVVDICPVGEQHHPQPVLGHGVGVSLGHQRAGGGAKARQEEVLCALEARDRLSQANDPLSHGPARQGADREQVIDAHRLEHRCHVDGLEPRPQGPGPRARRAGDEWLCCRGRGG